MSKGTIKYSQEFKSEFGNRWIGIDLVINDGDDWNEKYQEAESRVQEWGGYGSQPISRDTWKSTFPEMDKVVDNFFKQPIQSIDPKAKDLKEIIQDCTSIEDLQELKNEAGRLGLLAEYSNKLKTLQ